MQKHVINVTHTARILGVQKGAGIDKQPRSN